MPIPDYQSIMLPLLNFCSRKGTETSTSESAESLSREFKLTEAELKELLPSGTQTTFLNRVGWSATYMKKAGLLESTRRGFFKITARGKELLKNNPQRIDVNLLKEYPEFIKFQSLKGTRKKTITESHELLNMSTPTPSEALEQAYQNISGELADEIIDKLKNVTPPFFERIVVELLVKMGYGGSRADAGKAIGRAGDGGIDGIIKEDKLGLDVIYIQAKRWDETPVGRREVQQFAGALQGQRANKGIFITTSYFTDEAVEYAAKIGSKIVLIDGELLSKLMIEYDIGVSTISTYPLKRIDSDYFNENI